MSRHPADDLYYLDSRLIKHTGACFNQRHLWYHQFGHMRVPITLKLAAHLIYEQPGRLRWALNAMHRRGKIKLHELDAYHHQERIAIMEIVAPSTQYWRVRSRIEARLFMDLLLTRAKREGRIK